ncbi:serine protease inhibitor dipetalogastin-like [Bicyclus anynana]|uniref:Serine protease inhibitor dipetalogastin-like n=1 Tax=Bicyclus anynana TaxID=110368 RepID=A0A6J1NBB8_BICAN|nr:serine protease inhibitor dipetalogastin-like [Bicyclus anynana]
MYVIIVTIAASLALTLLHAALASCGDFDVKRPAVQPAVCACEYNYEPVCGDDGVTYINKCVLECYNANAAKKGKPPVAVCEDGSTCTDCVCQPIYLPVCSVDGKTYPNECELSCENYRRLKSDKPLVYLAYRAECLGPCCDCSTVASPVCGCDDVLYRNLCELECANKNALAQGLPAIEFQNAGACLEGCQCPDVKAPVCGTDGVEYANLCQMACQNRKKTCSLSPPIKPAPKDVCLPCVCPAKYDPVCGSDRENEPRTFPNMCELNCEAKRTRNPELMVIGFGACPNCYCTNEYIPVCGTDCKTYRNECELRCANDCRSKQDDPISMFHYGACVVMDCDCRECSREYQPVCGSDGVTYWNLEWLNCNSGCSKKNYGKPIMMVSKGACRV